MDLLLLGAMAVVLIALTVWLVWRPSTEAARPEANSVMTPMGDEFEDQYTSATADLSAGGVAVANAAPQEELATEAVSEPRTGLPQAPIGHEASATGLGPVTPTAVPSPSEPQVQAEPEPATRGASTPRKVGMGAAAAFTLGGAAAGAWLYTRWQRERNKPINRLRRRFR
jgi:hypothetical protein